MVFHYAPTAALLVGSALSTTRPAALAAFHTPVRPHYASPAPSAAAAAAADGGGARIRIVPPSRAAASTLLSSSRWNGDGYNGYGWDDDGRPFDGGQQRQQLQQQQQPHATQGESYHLQFSPPPGQERQQQQQRQWQTPQGQRQQPQQQWQAPQEQQQQQQQPQQQQQWQDQQQQQQQWQDQEQWENNGSGLYAEGENRNDGGYYYQQPQQGQQQQEYYESNEYAPRDDNRQGPANGGWAEQHSATPPPRDSANEYYYPQQQQQQQEEQPQQEQQCSPPPPPDTIEDIRRERERLRREMADLQRREDELLLGRRGEARVWQQTPQQEEQRRPESFGGAIQRWNVDESSSGRPRRHDSESSELIFPMTSPFEMMDRFMDDMMGSMLGGRSSSMTTSPLSLLHGGGMGMMADQFAEQERRTDDLVSEARRIVLSSPEGTEAREMLGEPASMDERPYSRGSGTSVIDGWRTERVLASLRVAGSRGSGIATLEARDGIIVSLTVVMDDDGRTVNVDVSSTASTASDSGGNGDVIEAEVVDAEESEEVNRELLRMGDIPSTMI